MTRIRWDGHLGPHWGLWPWVTVEEFLNLYGRMAREAFGRTAWFSAS